MLQLQKRETTIDTPTANSNRLVNTAKTINGGEALNCDSPELHHPVAPTLQEQVLELGKAERMAEFFSLLADANRLRILSILAIEEHCVGDLATTLGMNDSAVSHQLKTLRAMRLVKHRKQGRHVFYRLQDHHVLDLYQTVAEHLDESGIE